MRSVFVAEAAVLLVLYSTRLLLLVLGSRVIAVFTDRAFECNYVSHISSLVKQHHPEAAGDGASSRRDLNP